MLKKIGIIVVAFFCAGCSWEVFPFIRNFTTGVVRIKVISLTGKNDEFDRVVYTSDSIYSIDHDTKIHFDDTLKVDKVSSNTWTVDIPPRSTSLVKLPYGWRYEKYAVTAEQATGRIDTLNRSINFTVVRADGKSAQYPRAFTNDMIYFDIK